MILPTRDELAQTLKQHRVSRRLVRDLRYVPEEVTDANEREYLAITTKSGNEGVLLYGAQLVSFTLAKRSPNQNGRIEAIICDICATWQRGTNSAVLSFKKSDKKTVSYLVCADLDCSLHVRGLTAASTLSRTQLREQIDVGGRIARLHNRLRLLLDS